MKTLVLPLALLASASALRAQVALDFQHANYVTGNSIASVVEPGVTPSLTWGVQFGSPAGSATIASYANSKALKIDSIAGSVSANLAGLGAHVAFTDNLIALSFDFAVDAAGDANSASHVRIGGTAFGTTGASWLGLRLTGASIGFYSSNGTANSLSTVANYADLVNARGEYITVTVVVDTTTNKYSSLTFVGTKASVDATSAVAGLTLPLANLSAPTNSNLYIHAVGSDNTLHYFDNISIGVIPEPSSYALLTGAGLLGFAVLRRRSRA